MPVLRSPWAPHSTLGSHGGQGSHEGFPTGPSPALTWALVHAVWPIRVRLRKQQDPEAGRAWVGVDGSDSLQRKEKAGVPVALLHGVESGAPPMPLSL